MLLAETSQACRLVALANGEDVRLFGGYGLLKIRVLVHPWTRTSSVVRVLPCPARCSTCHYR